VPARAGTPERFEKRLGYGHLNGLTELHFCCVVSRVSRRPSKRAAGRRERRGEKELARKHLSLYLHYEPQGPWAEFARSRMRPSRLPRHSAIRHS